MRPTISLDHSLAMSRDFVSDVNLPEGKASSRNYGRRFKVIYCRRPAAMAEQIRQRDPFQSFKRQANPGLPVNW